MLRLSRRQRRKLLPVAYRIDEAADISGLSLSKLYNEIAGGRLRTTLIGRSRRVLHDDLLRVMKAGRSQTCRTSTDRGGVQ